ncbi:hypothetical protein IW261DRAFT_1611842 [Armillaria novae-zelandiae]|uniref:Uncharacterized protein n=1 Tax=Armillaria novae-zelandiae TaxID=153914 RepID=A0AA39T8N8_9AGAR|nr:hypothetical protein IW261DRAFT_1611842 [Armillaria novae-zelandiae]
MTPIGMESLPDTGTKINLTMCPGPTSEDGIGFVIGTVHDNGTDYYGTCAWPNDDILPEGLGVIENNSSTSRSVMVDDMAVLVPSTMPDNVHKLTFSSFGLVTRCQRVVDCYLIGGASKTDSYALHCPTFDPAYYINGTIADCSSGSTINMFNMTNNVVRETSGFHPLHSVLNPYGVLLTTFWANDDILTDDTPGWLYLPAGCYGTLDGNNGYAFATPPVLSDFNTTTALFTAFFPSYQTSLVNYLIYTLKTTSALFTEVVFNTLLSRNMSYAAVGLVSSSFRTRQRQERSTESTAIELVQLRLTNALASIAERFSDPARPELLLETSAVDMFHEHPHAEKLGVVISDDEGEDSGEGIIRRRRTFKVESIERRLMTLSGSTITSDSDFGPKEN